MDSIFDELKELIIINGDLDIEKSEINENTDLVNDFAYNSIALVLLMIAIEDKWGIDMSDGDTDSSLLVQVGYLLNRIKESNSN